MDRDERGGHKKLGRKRQPKPSTDPLPEADLRDEASKVGDSVVDRVEFIARIMASNEWIPGVSHRRLSAAWGVQPVCIRRYAAEASRNVRRDIGDSEEIRQRALVALENFARVANTMAGSHYGYVKAGIDAIALMTGLGGCPPVTRTEQTGKDGAPLLAPVIMLPPEDKDGA